MNHREKRWIERIKADVGCLACYKESGELGTPADAHHLLNGGRRISHMHTIGLCAWHHRGVGDGAGPSLAKNKREFHETYGDDEHLLWLARALVRKIEQNTIGAKVG